MGTADPLADAWNDLRDSNPQGVEAGIRGLITIHGALEPAWLADRFAASERVAMKLHEVRAARQQELQSATAREQEAVVAAERRKSEPPATLGTQFTDNMLIEALSEAGSAVDGPSAEEIRETARRSLDRMELPEEPFDFSRLCREIGRGISRLSPLLGALYLRQAICSEEDFLVSHDSEPLIEFQDLELWYRCVFKILRVGYDYEPQLANYLGLAVQIDEINTIFREASGAVEHWTYRDGGRIGRLREICVELAANARPIGEWVTALDSSELRAALESQPGDDASAYTEEQLQRGRRVVASRDLASACLDLTSGRPRDALSRLGEAKWSYEWNIGGSDDELGDLLILRTSIVRAEARAAIGLDPFDEKSASVLASWSTAFFSNWLDQRHPAAWAPEDSEDWQLDLDEWLNSNSTPFESGAIGAQLKEDLVVRLAVLSRGSLRATPWLNPVDHVFTERNALPIPTEQAALQLISKMEPLLEQLRSMPARQDHLLDVMLDVRSDQRTVTEILTLPGENRVAAADRLLRAAAPNWLSLDEDSRRELTAAELEYRAYLSGDRLPEQAAAVAALFWRPIEHQYNLWTRDREISGWPPKDPPNWNEFKKERNFALHPNIFREIDLTRMRSYLFGLHRGDESLLQALATSATHRTRKARG